MQLADSTHSMSDGLQQLSISLFFTAIAAVLTWVITRFYKTKELELKSDAPWKDAFLAIGYVAAFIAILGIVFLFLVQSSGGPIGTSEDYNLYRALKEWMIYGLTAFIPVVVIIRFRKQRFETVGITHKNLKLSVGVGIVLSILFISLSTTPERFLSRFLSWNTFYAAIYFISVGFGEELLFRGFLQLRCSAWLGEARGFILASVIMALAHIPQRVFVAGLDPFEAAINSLLLIPFSLLMGFLMLRTKNVFGPTILHTVANIVSVL